MGAVKSWRKLRCCYFDSCKRDSLNEGRCGCWCWMMQHVECWMTWVILSAGKPQLVSNSSLAQCFLRNIFFLNIHVRNLTFFKKNWEIRGHSHSTVQQKTFRGLDSKYLHTVPGIIKPIPVYSVERKVITASPVLYGGLRLTLMYPGLTHVILIFNDLYIFFT